jgi:hypothetical protein
MFGYGIGIMPLIHKLKREFPAVKQPWYIDDAGTGDCFADLRKFFLWLQEIGPTYGYFPEPTKSILITQSPGQPSRTCNFKSETGSCYLLVATSAPKPIRNFGSMRRSPSGPLWWAD